MIRRLLANTAFGAVGWMALGQAETRWERGAGDARESRDEPADETGSEGSPSEGIAFAAGPCPPGMASVRDGARAFCIDQYEGSLVEIDEGRASRPRPHSPFETVAGKRVRAVSKRGVVPQGYISANEAEAACREAGKRLCTADEWLRACRGEKATKYPYGDDEVKGRCNGDGSRLHPMAEVFAGDPDAFADATKMNDPRLNALPGSLAKTGSHARCKSPGGVFDMVGNLHEWTADPNGTFRGGYYMDTHRNGDGCTYKTTAHARWYHDYSTGFRCCK